MLIAYAVGRLVLQVPRLQFASATTGLMCVSLAGVLFFEWLPLDPELHWQWLPALILFSSVLSLLVNINSRHLGKHTELDDSEQSGSVPEARFSLRHAIQVTLFAFLAILTAYFLMPDWQKLNDVRFWYGIVLSMIIFTVCWMTHSGTIRARPTLSSTVLALTSIATGIVLFHSGSLKFAQFAGLPAAACIAWRLLSRNAQFKPSCIAIATPAYTIAITGLLFCGYINSFSSVPVACYLLCVFAPASLFFHTHDKLTLPKLALHLLPLVIAVIWATTRSLLDDL